MNSIDILKTNIPMLNHCSSDGYSDDDIFADLPPQDAFDVKKQYIAADLIALLVSSGVNKTTLADKLGWHKSAITRLFSGKSNPTAKTIWSLSTYLGYDFDIAFRKPEDPPARQPWHHSASVTSHVEHFPESNSHIFVKFQTPGQVNEDMKRGTPCRAYIGITSVENTDIKTINPRMLIAEEDVNTINTRKLLLNKNMTRTTVRAK